LRKSKPLKKPPEKPKRTEHSKTIENKWAAEHFDVEPTAPLRAVEFTLYGFAAARVRSAVNPPGEGKNEGTAVCTV
jgi:hypothetical protein